MAETSKPTALVDAKLTSADPESAVEEPKQSRWQRVQEVIWDGPRSKEERRLVKRLDIYLL
jgi:hypothetical protein